MKKNSFIAMAAMAIMALPTTAMAQDDDDWSDEELPVSSTIDNGYFRIVNNGYGDVLSTNGTHQFGLTLTENSARTVPASIFYYDTNGIYNFADDMAQLGDNISVGDLMRLMTTSAWKSGSYTTYDLASQGISFGGYLRKLGEYTNTVLANFAESQEVKDFYENGPAWYLSAAMSGAFYPADMESLDTFKAAVTRWMKQWKNYFDFNIYLKPAQDMENCFLMHFHSPMDISKVQDTQEQINNMASEEGGSLGYHYDFFGCFKRKVVEEAAKELDEQGVAFLQHIMDQLELDKEYYIGENEQGELYVVGFSKEAMFGENGELASINQDELIWTMQPVDDVNPLMVEMPSRHIGTDGYYYTTLFTDFAYQLGEGVEAYYIDAINDGKAHLVAIDGKVPAQTGVILRSKSKAAVSNVLLPIDEEVAAISGNLLKGTCLPIGSIEGAYAMSTTANEQGTAGAIEMSPVSHISANTCYTEQHASIVALDVAGIETAERQHDSARHTAFDLQGRSTSSTAKGVYIVDGKKMVK
ncbi:MAG: hypothetical protein IJV24_07885 [Prevotella sp.]|nr:hypothetical protein [Prevotella sp.]